MVVTIKSAEEYKKQVKQAEANKLVVVDFFATWCGPCKMIGPKIEKMAKEEFPDVLFFKVDVDEVEDVAQEENISAMPTFILYKNGERLVGQEIMGANEAAIRSKIEQNK